MVKTNVTLGDLLRARMHPETTAMYKLVNELVAASSWTRNDVEKTAILSAANLLLSQHAANKAQEIRLREKTAQLDEAGTKILRLENQIGFLKHKIGTPPVDSLEKQRIQQLELQIEELQADLIGADNHALKLVKQRDQYKEQRDSYANKKDRYRSLLCEIRDKIDDQL